MWAILRIWALLHGRYVSGSLGLGREAFTSHLIALEGVSSLETPRLDAPPKNPLYKGFIVLRLKCQSTGLKATLSGADADV